MKWLDYALFFFFILGVMAVGILFMRRKYASSSLFSADSSMPWPIGGLSLFMSFFSAGTFVVWGTVAYNYGWVAITIQWGIAIAGVACGLFIAPKWHKLHIVTAADYIERRFSKKTKQFYSLLYVLLVIFTTGTLLYPAARIIEVATAIPLACSILIICAFCIVCAAAGGLWGIMITDVLQFVILTIATLLLVPLSVDKIGGVDSLITSLAGSRSDLTNNEYTWLFIIAFSIYNCFSLAGNWGFIQRYSSIKSTGGVRKVGLLFGLLYFVFPVLWMLPAMACRILAPDLSGLQGETAYFYMCREALPTGLMGMMVGSILFTTTTSFNSSLNIMSAVFFREFLYNRQLPEQKKTNYARLITIGFGLLSVFVAFMIQQMGGLLEVVINIAAIAGAPLYTPIIWSLFSSRITSKEARTTTIISLAINLFYIFALPSILNYAPNKSVQMLLSIAMPCIILSFMEVYRKYTHPTLLIKSFATQDLPTPDEKYSQLVTFSIRVIGFCILIIGATVTTLSFVAHTGQLYIVLTGITTVAIGMIICRWSYKKAKQNSVQ